MLSYDSFSYFTELLIVCVVIYPLYHLAPKPALRRALLTFTGLYLVFLIAPRLALFYCIFWLVIAGLQPLASVTGEKPYATPLLWALVVAVAAPMVIWKIWEADFVPWFNVFFSESTASLSGNLGAVDEVRDILVPIGLSFATFRAADLLVQSSLGVVPKLSPGRVFFYGFFPPVQVIGPIIEYNEVGPRAEQLQRPTFADYRASAVLVLRGLVKVFVLALPLEASGEVFIYFETNGPIVVWVELILFAWFFYLNFSGFSDVAIGVARLFGFKLKPNFDRPYTRQNPQEFWNNWHMSLTRSAQRNVFVPLGGMRPERQYLALACTMMVIALWHDVSVPLVLFGLYHGSGLIAWRLVSARRPAMADPSLGIRTLKASMQFIYYIISLPLLLLDLETAGHFYQALMGA